MLYFLKLLHKFWIFCFVLLKDFSFIYLYNISTDKFASSLLMFFDMPSLFMSPSKPFFNFIIEVLNWRNFFSFFLRLFSLALPSSYRMLYNFPNSANILLIVYLNSWSDNSKISALSESSFYGCLSLFRLCFYLPFRRPCNFFLKAGYPVSDLITKVNRPFNVSFYFNQAKYRSVFSSCSSCICQRLRFPQVFFFFLSLFVSVSLNIPYEP